MFTITIANGWFTVLNTVTNITQAFQLSNLYLTESDGSLVVVTTLKKLCLHPSSISSVNGAPISPSDSVSSIITIIQTASTLPGGSSSMSILTVTATAGTTIIDAGLSGTTAHVVFINGIAVITGYTLVGTTITFTDGTTFGGGEIVKILIS